jgi:hypothetical protein
VKVLWRQGDRPAQRKILKRLFLRCRCRRSGAAGTGKAGPRVSRSLLDGVRDAGKARHR